MIIKENVIDYLEFTKLRNDEGFQSYSLIENKKSLEKSLYTIFIYEKNTAVACARVVGDGITTFFLKDVIVSSEHRGKGVGALLINNIEKYIKSVCCENAYVGLMSTKKAEKFYSKMGYNKRPNSNQGSGFHKYINKQ